MNQTAKDLAMRLAQREYSSVEYRSKLVRMQNMGFICHCSAEVNTGTQLYFSVNDMYLGEGSFIVVLFSEVGGRAEEQDDGLDVFDRMYTYAIIEETVKEIFAGRFSFYSSELDGRLAVIVNFPFGLLPDISIIDYLDMAGTEVSRRCRELYDMDVVAYIGNHTDNIRSISSVYEKLLDRATLHRYVEHVFDAPVYHVRMLTPGPLDNRVDGLREQTRMIVNHLMTDTDPHPLITAVLEDLAANQASNVDELKRMFGDFFEDLYSFCAQVGIKVRKGLRREQFDIIMNSVHWRELTSWSHKTVDLITRDHAERKKKAARRRFDQAVEYIDSALSDPDLSVEKCAAAAGCSVSAITKMFRRQLNTSAAKYIRDARLDMALRLIHQGATVKATCAQCGFGSTETFHRAFKSRYGITPGQLRGADLSETEDG